MTEHREKFRAGLSKLYLPHYDKLCQLLGPEWQPYCGIRTIQEQDALYAKGRTSFPIGPQFIVTQSTGGSSPHNYGCASDWILWGEKGPIWLARDDAAWNPYLDAIQKAGLRSGSYFSFRDFPHNELPITCGWKHVHIAYQQGGMTAAQQHVEINLEHTVGDSSL